MDSNKTSGEKSLTAITQGCCELYWTSSQGNTPQKSSCTATYHPSWKLSKLDEPDMWDTVEEARTNSSAINSCGPLHMDEQRQDDQLEPTNNSYVLIQDIVWKTSWEQWTLETGGKRGSGRSMLAAWYPDDDTLTFADFPYLFCCSFHTTILTTTYIHTYLHMRYLRWPTSTQIESHLQAYTANCYFELLLTHLLHLASGRCPRGVMV